MIRISVESVNKVQCQKFRFVRSSSSSIIQLDNRTGLLNIKYAGRLFLLFLVRSKIVV